MNLRCAVTFYTLLSTASPLLACEINGLTEAIDLLKRGDEPTAYRVAFACSNIIQNREVEKSLGEIVLTLHSTFDKNLKLKEAITNCPPDAIRRAC